MKINHIVWMVSTLEDTKFLKEFAKKFNHKITVFHLNLITRFDLINFKGEHFLPFASHMVENVPLADTSKSFNVLSGRLTKQDADKAYKISYSVFEKIFQDPSDPSTIIMIPSGRHVHHMAARDFANKNCIKTIYINYSNFPGYTFFDPEGTDCLSSIFHKPELLDLLYPDQVNVEEVFQHFSELKQKQVHIPQANNKKIKELAKSLTFKADTFAQVLLNYYGDRRIGSTLKSGSNVEEFIYDSVNLKDDFIFFPLQVSTDQQVLVNYSGGSIFSALDEAINIAKEKGVKLFVREHPAEGNVESVRSYLNSKRKDETILKVTNTPVFDLIRNSAEVITINSTIGLECRLNHKKITFLGKSFYEKTSEQQLAKYLSCYLVSTDYHNPVITHETVNKVLSFAGEI